MEFTVCKCRILHFRAFLSPALNVTTGACKGFTLTVLPETSPPQDSSGELSGSWNISVGFLVFVLGAVFAWGLVLWILLLFWVDFFCFVFCMWVFFFLFLFFFKFYCALHSQVSPSQDFGLLHSSRGWP